MKKLLYILNQYKYFFIAAVTMVPLVFVLNYYMGKKEDKNTKYWPVSKTCPTATGEAPVKWYSALSDEHTNELVKGLERFKKKTGKDLFKRVYTIGPRTVVFKPATKEMYNFDKICFLNYVENNTLAETVVKKNNNNVSVTIYVCIEKIELILNMMDYELKKKFSKVKSLGIEGILMHEAMHLYKGKDHYNWGDCGISCRSPHEKRISDRLAKLMVGIYNKCMGKSGQAKQ